MDDNEVTHINMRETQAQINGVYILIPTPLWDELIKALLFEIGEEKMTIQTQWFPKSVPHTTGGSRDLFKWSAAIKFIILIFAEHLDIFGLSRSGKIWEQLIYVESKPQFKGHNYDITN